MDQFFAIDGNRYLVFFYQEPEIDNYPNGGNKKLIMKFSYKTLFLVNSFRPRYSPYSSRSGASSAKSIKPKVIIADLVEQSFRGICLCFLRNTNKIIITEQNIANV
jgi:hypothetical protein